MTQLIKPEGLKIAMIVATDRNSAIGKAGTLPWKHKGDMSFFKRTTTGHTVIMGRKTFDSMNRKPLKNRKNLVLTSNLFPTEMDRDETSNAMTYLQAVRSVQSALDTADFIREEESDPSPVFVIGGESLYRAFLPISDILYISQLDLEVEGADTQFLPISVDEWDINHQINHPPMGDDVRWSMTCLTRKPKLQE